MTRAYEPLLEGTLGEQIMVLEFSVVIEKDEEGYFVASVPALRGCHTQAKSLDVLMRRIREAIELCLEAQEPVANEFVGVQRVSVTV
jgi:predicted RNase H-like HicB family nuclease